MAQNSPKARAHPPRPMSPAPPETDEKSDIRPLLLNRELSWIEFNRRVLGEALDHAHPLLERVKFLTIFETNLDEFFMIRVSGLIQQVDAGVSTLSRDGLSAAQQLKAISEALRPLLAQHRRCLREEILPELEALGVSILDYPSLSDTDRARLEEYFEQRVFPVLTPLAVDPSHPFPYISNLSLSLAVELSVWNERDEVEETRFARVKVPLPAISTAPGLPGPVVPRLVPIPGGGHRFVRLEAVIAANIGRLFPDVVVRACYPFRVTRDADIDIEDDEARDLLREIEQQLRKRRFGSAVRLEVDPEMPPHMLRYLTTSLELEDIDVYPVAGMLAVRDLMALYRLDLPHLKDSPFRPTVPSILVGEESVFDILKRQDILLHHPYESFGPVVDFISAATADPSVVAIKQTLYRTSGDSPVVKALITASERGKQVAVLVELKARFDEENNIVWARRMEEAGVHVVYGIVGLKTHTKIALVVRQEAEGLRRYVHLGTGNYNPSTARVYTDYGLLTADPDIGADATDLFNYLTGLSHQRHYRKLIVAPLNLRPWLFEKIQRETENARAGRPARIVAKLNALSDVRIIRSLITAAEAGVKIDLLIRGICCIRPQVAGQTDNIRVRSVVGRFLEHSRVFYFENDGDPVIYLSSADWMERNLAARVETTFPVTDQRLKTRLMTELLSVMFKDNVKSHELGPDGVYRRRRPESGEARIDSQRSLLDEATIFQE